MIQSCVLLGTLGLHSIEEKKKKKITVNLTLISAILGVLLHLLFQNQSIFMMLTGMLSGAAVLAAAYLTKGKIGIGDGMVFMLTGLYLGLKENLLLMLISFSAAGLFQEHRCKKAECQKNRYSKNSIKSRRFHRRSEKRIRSVKQACIIFQASENRFFNTIKFTKTII